MDIMAVNVAIKRWILSPRCVMLYDGIYEEAHADSAGDRCKNGKSLDNDQAKGAEDVSRRGHHDGGDIGQSEEGRTPAVNSNLSGG